MSKNKIKTDKLLTIIYRELFDIIDDETGHPSYRKYLDKVIKDIFDLEDIGTGFLMAHNQFKYLKRLINDPDSKEFCQMLLRNEDVKALHQLVRAAYDITQIANKPKKKITTKDIKSYRYLTELYAKSVKKLRKKYKTDYAESKKSYMNKYSDLDKLAGGSKYQTPHYEFSDIDYFDDDDNESLEEYIDNDEEDIDIGFDVSDLPTEFIIKGSSKKSKKNHMILDGDDERVELYSNNSEDEDEDSEDDGVMPQAEFQRYVLSLFETLINKVDAPKSEEPHKHTILIDVDEDCDSSDSPIENTTNDEDIKFTLSTPINPINIGIDVNADVYLDSAQDSECNDQIPNEKKEYAEMSTPELITEFNNHQASAQVLNDDSEQDNANTTQDSKE